MEIKPELKKAFDKGVERYFQKIADEYSCRLKKINDLTFHLEHSNYFVKIGCFRSHTDPNISVTIHPNRKIYKRLGEDWHSIGCISSILIPDFKFSLGEIKTKKDVFFSLERQAMALVNCCDKMLRGDFSQWRKINKIFKAELKESIKQRIAYINRIKFEPNLSPTEALAKPKEYRRIPEDPERGTPQKETL